MESVSPLISQDLQSVSRVEEKCRNGIELVGSAGKSAENGEIQDDDHDDNGNDVESACPEAHLVAGVAPERDLASARQVILCLLSVCIRQNTAEGE